MWMALCKGIGLRSSDAAAVFGGIPVASIPAYANQRPVGCLGGGHPLPYRRLGGSGVCCIIRIPPVHKTFNKVGNGPERSEY